MPRDIHHKASSIRPPYKLQLSRRNWFSISAPILRGAPDTIECLFRRWGIDKPATTRLNIHHLYFEFSNSPAFCAPQILEQSLSHVSDSSQQLYAIKVN